MLHAFPAKFKDSLTAGIERFTQHRFLYEKFLAEVCALLCNFAFENSCNNFFKAPWIYISFHIILRYWSMKVWCLRGRQPPKQRAPILWLIPRCLQWLGLAQGESKQRRQPGFFNHLSHHCCHSGNTLAGSKNRELQLGIEPRLCEVSRRHFNCSLSAPDSVCTLRCREIFINVFLWRLKKNYFKVTEQRSPNYWFSPPNSPNSWGWARTNSGKIQSLSSTWMSGAQAHDPTPAASQGTISRKLESGMEQGLQPGHPKVHLTHYPNEPHHHLSPPEIKVEKKRNRPGFVTRRHGYVFWCLILINVWSWPSGFVLRLRPTKIYLLLFIPPKCPHSYIPHCRDRVL